MNKLTFALVATGAFIFAACSDGPSDSLDIAEQKRHLKDIREQHSNSSYETSQALKKLAAAYSRRGHTSESEILLQLVIVIDRDVRQQGQLEYDIELEEELTRHYSKMAEAYKKGDFKSHYEHSAHLLLYSRRVAINDLSRHHSLLVKAINRDGVAPYLSWMIDYAYRLAKINSADTRSKFSQLAELYTKQYSNNEPPKSGIGAPVLVRSENGYRLYSRNIAEATTKLLFSKIGENEFLYGSIPRDFSKFAALVEQCNELMNKSEDVVRDERICEELAKYYDDNKSKDSGTSGDLLSDFQVGGFVDVAGCLMAEINAQRETESITNALDNYESCKAAQLNLAYEETGPDPTDRGMDRYTKGEQSYEDRTKDRLDKEGYVETKNPKIWVKVVDGKLVGITAFTGGGASVEIEVVDNGNGTSTLTTTFESPGSKTVEEKTIIKNKKDEEGTPEPDELPPLEPIPPDPRDPPEQDPDPSNPVDPCMNELFPDADWDAEDDVIGVGFGILDPWINPGPDGAPVTPIPGAERLGACYKQYDVEEASSCAALILCVDGIDEDCNCVTDVEPFIIRGAPACSNVTCPEGSTCDMGSGFCKTPGGLSGPPVLTPGTGPLPPRPGEQ